MSIQEQIAWERECLERGTARYYANQDRLRETGASDQTDVVSYLLKDRLVESAQLLDDISNNKFAKHRGNNQLINAAADGDYLKLMYIGAQATFQLLLAKKENTVTKICISIASRIETDLKCQLFEAEHPAYYAVVNRSFTDQKVTDYVHKHKVMMKKFNDFDLDWLDWTAPQKIHIGSRILRCLLEVFDDVLFLNKVWSGVKSTNILDTKPEFDIWSAEFEKERGFMFPAFLPMKIAPRAWEDNHTGGYYTPGMSSRMPFIKTRGKEHRACIEKADPRAHRKAVNKMQRTPWAINKRVLAVQQEVYEKDLGIGLPSSSKILPPEFPPHLKDLEKGTLNPEQKEEVVGWKMLAKRAYSEEQKRKGQVLAFMQSHKLAKEIQDWEKLYFVYNNDFRGRIYCATSGLSPQGADTAKGLLRFAKGVILGHSGVRWLAIHGANTYGVDKISYEDRIAWVKNNACNIRRVAEDPIGGREFWGAADKPYQFLAFCFDWAECDYGNNHNATSSVPVGLDGSCNGLQHYSAMLKDDVGAEATNLLACDTPQDIYQEVADVCTQKLEALEDNALADIWLRVGISRKCTKRPVMTLPYGATQQSARMYVLEYIQDNWAVFELDESHQWELAKFVTPYLWESIGEVVVAAREGMAWLQKNITSDYVSWVTPIGFPVYQYYKKVEAIDVKTQLNGRMKLRTRDANGEGVPNKVHQRNGIAPNFVHSIDSTHMVMTINITDLPAYAMIHDDFGTHAGNTEVLFKAIRIAFRSLYTKYNPLEEWGQQVGADLDTLPEQGTYDINNITKAAYFFG